jgi:hypothetical protein
MNLRSLARRGIATAALLAATLPATAAVFSFSGLTDSGPLPDSPFSGQFSFADPVAGFDGSVALDSFTLLAFGQTYALADADSPATAFFVGGVFTGVDFFDQDSLDVDTRPNVSLVAGFFDPTEAFFSYATANDAQGFGSSLPRWPRCWPAWPCWAALAGASRPETEALDQRRRRAGQHHHGGGAQAQPAVQVLARHALGGRQVVASVSGGVPGYAGDRIDPAPDVTGWPSSGRLDPRGDWWDDRPHSNAWPSARIALAQRTMRRSRATRARLRPAAAGPPARRAAGLPAPGHHHPQQHGRRPPEAAGAAALAVARELGLPRLRVAVVTGDDVLTGCAQHDVPATIDSPPARIRPRRPPGLGQRLSGRRCAAAGAGRRRRRRDHRPRGRPGAVPGAADAPPSAGAPTTGRAGPGRAGRPPAGMRGPGQRRLHRRPRALRRAGPGTTSAFRWPRCRPTAGRHHQAARHRRPRRPADLHRPAALRDRRPGAPTCSPTWWPTSRRCSLHELGPDRVQVQRRHGRRGRPAQGHAGLPRRLHRRRADLLCRPGRAGARPRWRCRCWSTACGGWAWARWNTGPS